MVDDATAKYLNDNVGSVLAKALAEMSIAQPTDGVDFLAKWLQTYAEQEEAKVQRAAEEKALAEERAKTQAKLDEQEKRREKQAAEVESNDAKYSGFVEKMNNPDTVFDDSCWCELLEVAQSLTGSTAAYLGCCDEEGIDGVEGRCIYYTHTSSGSTAMNFFAAADGEERVLTQDMGVTWNALVENPGEEVEHLWKPPKPDPVVPEGEAAEAEGDAAAQAPSMPYYPVSVPCVTDVEKDAEGGKRGVHFFEMTRLGAYFAVPLVYSSYCGQEALTDAIQYEEDKKNLTITDVTAADTAQKAEEAAAAAADGAEGEKQPELVLSEEKAIVLRGAPTKLVLCLDTLGTNTALDEAKLPELVDLCKAVGKCKENTEIKQVDMQARASLRKPLEAQEIEVLEAAAENPKLVDKASLKEESRRVLAEEKLREKLETDIPQCRSDVAAALQAELDADDAAATEDDQKDLVQKKYAYLKARNAALALKDIINELKTWVVVTPEFLNVIAATAFMYGFTKEKLYPKRKSTLKWDKLQTVLDEEFLFFDAIQKTDICAARTGLAPDQKLASVLAMASPAGYDEAKAKEVSPAFELIFTLIQSACAYRKAHLDLAKTAYNARKEEAGEAFDEKPLEEVDDDYVE